mgnify:CR=1 FL=1
MLEMKFVIGGLFKLLRRYHYDMNSNSVLRINLLLINVSLHCLNQMRMLGIYSRLDQIFEAPYAVREVLISQFGLEYSVC